MNGIAAACMELISLRRIDDAVFRCEHELVPACTLVGGGKGAWPLCVVGSKFTKIGFFVNAMGLFENALMLDGSASGKVNRGSFQHWPRYEGRGSASVAALTLSGDMLFQGNLRLKIPTVVVLSRKLAVERR